MAYKTLPLNLVRGCGEAPGLAEAKAELLRLDARIGQDSLDDEPQVRYALCVLIVERDWLIRAIKVDETSSAGRRLGHNQRDARPRDSAPAPGLTHIHQP